MKTQTNRITWELSPLIIHFQVFCPDGLILYKDETYCQEPQKATLKVPTELTCTLLIGMSQATLKIFIYNFICIFKMTAQHTDYKA